MLAPAAEEGGEARPVTPRAIREVLAVLDDAEADALDTYLSDLDDERYAQACREATAIEALEARLVWTRALIGRASHQEQSAVPASEAESAPLIEIPGIPSQLVPVLAQLTPDEQLTGVQLLSWLDRATTERVTADLLSLPPEGALAKIRRMIAEARRRGPSVAQRAVASVFSDGNNGVAGHGGAP
jgi:hypothetical protein